MLLTLQKLLLYPVQEPAERIKILHYTCCSGIRKDVKLSYGTHFIHKNSIGYYAGLIFN